MTIRRFVVSGVHSLATRSGLMARLCASRWRSRRLLILCYHGFSLRDEHQWRPALYMTGDTFAARLGQLTRLGATVLPLSEALDRLHRGALPKAAVAITVDDGMYDFLEIAYPVLRRWGFPVTLYCSTWYVENDLPVFDVMMGYLLWRGVENRCEAVTLEELGRTVLLTDRDSARRAGGELLSVVRQRHYSGTQKHEILERLATGVGEDLESLRARRILSLLRPHELQALDPSIVDVQLHTHRHRSPMEREEFIREIRDNRDALVSAGLGKKELVHFCYPSGVHAVTQLPWLREVGITSATTCRPGLASRRSDPLVLPRYVDTQDTPAWEFAGWVSGLRDLLQPWRR